MVVFALDDGNVQPLRNLAQFFWITLLIYIVFFICRVDWWTCCAIYPWSGICTKPIHLEDGAFDSKGREPRNGWILGPVESLELWRLEAHSNKWTWIPDRREGTHWYWTGQWKSRIAALAKRGHGNSCRYAKGSCSIIYLESRWI